MHQSSLCSARGIYLTQDTKKWYNGVMSEAILQAPPVEADEVKFPEQPKLDPCTSMYCPNGHGWPPIVALARCGCGTPQGWNGCASPILAMKMQNCPVCNEPAMGIKLRIDHTPPVGYPSPMCIPGSATPAEVVTVNIMFSHATVTEEQQEKKENGKGI